MNRRNVLVLAAVGAAMVILLAGCGGTQGSNSGSGQDATTGGTGGGATVIEQGLAFEPATLEVSVGDTVTFRNEDSATHDVLIDGKNLGKHGQGEEVTWKAEKAGTFPYSCTIHPSMTGEISVK